MKTKLNTLIAIILIAILVIGLLMWWNYKKTINRKYQACIEKCEAKAGKGFGYIMKKYSGEDLISPAEAEVCKIECREKYGK